ncbi:MAG: MSMEG_4193 family putative phosphomutase [Frankiaceae bacterium]|nr:MSMEG_4193 family putative phosphomutase [Frankiaceae bacterium]MBV9869142.1 MSMEG_4193 family putative phosphomutase [Frankiaceae bacterium]
MTTVLLVRHGLTDANTGGVLAGWTPGVHLAEKGREQAASLAARLADVPVAGIVSSPLERCRETAAAIAAGRDLKVSTDKRLGECHYGDWQGQELKKLVKDPLWKVVQAHPSAVQFPGGESMPAMQQRAVAAIRAHNAKFGEDATWIAVSHGDVIKSILADALGMHLDAFQRIQVDPCSMSVVRYTELRPFVVRMNDKGGPVTDLIPAKKKSRRKASSDAVVGGGAGSS